MKQTLLKGLAIASFAFFANSAMADGGGVQSISDALKDRATFFQNHKSLRLSQDVNGDDDSDRTAYIVVINYTNETIQAVLPNITRTLTFHTSATYFESDHGYHQPYRIQVISQSGYPIWDHYVYPRDRHAAHDTISVHGAYPNYTVYDTP